MDNMYKLLMGLSLFHGVTYERMLEVVGNTKLHFLKYMPGETIINAGDKCTHLKFLISGSIRTSITNNDGRFTVSQTLTAPEVVSPEYLFGLTTSYPCTATAIEPTGVMQIAKADYLKILNSDPIFMINYLNMLSLKAQKSVDGVLAVATGSLEERIAFWIVALTQRSATDIIMSCRQRDLYALFGVQRSSFIATLDDMRARGILEYGQSEIRILDRRKLVDIIKSSVE